MNEKVVIVVQARMSSTRLPGKVMMPILGKSLLARMIERLQMIRNKAPWDGKAFALHADRIAALAPQLLEGFPEGSDKGAETEAKADIWKSMDDFKSKLDDFVRESKALADVAKAGDEAKTRDQFKKTAGTCKACHDKYRNED